MERISDRADILTLRQANERFRNFFSRFSGTPILGTDEEVNALRQVELTLTSVADLLKRDVQSNPDPEIHEELQDYRANLVRLRIELGLMQNSATDCRARLFTRQNHLHAAKAWCSASRAVGKHS